MLKEEERISSWILKDKNHVPHIQKSQKFTNFQKIYSIPKDKDGMLS